jgi:hypothetical protein
MTAERERARARTVRNRWRLSIWGSPLPDVLVIVVEAGTEQRRDTGIVMIASEMKKLTATRDEEVTWVPGASQRADTNGTG